METDEQVSINAQDLINQLSSNFAVKVAQYEQTTANLQVTNHKLMQENKQLKAEKENNNAKND